MQPISATKNSSSAALSERFPQWLFIALFAFPALPLTVANILFIVFSSYVLLYWIYRKPLPIWKKIRTSLLIMLPFIPYLIEFLFHLNSAVMLFEFQKKILFFIAPLAIPVFIHVFNVKNFRPHFTCFILSIVAITLYALVLLLANNILFSESYSNGAYFLRLQFENYTHLHPTYYSLFAATALFFIMYNFENYSKGWKIFFTASAMLILVMLLLVAAKMPLLILALGTGWILYLKIKNRKKLMIIYAALLVFSCGVSFILPSLKSRVDEVKSYITANNPQSNTISQRSLIYDCSKEIFSDYFFTGTGASHAQQELDKCYKSKNPETERYKYNAHNQYLTLGINYGIFILLLFIFSISSIAKQLKHNLFGMIILLSIVLLMFTESILERQMGIYFYLLFLLVLTNTTSTHSTHPD